jgi:rod shape-determining protein MreC
VSLASFNQSPPPFFQQGPTSRTKLAFFAALAVFLMVADTRFQFVQPLRTALTMAMLPMQEAMMWPAKGWQAATDYLSGLEAAVSDRNQARAQTAALADKAARLPELESENKRLRALLELRPSLVPRTKAAEVLYVARDPYSRKVFIDAGSQQGISLGSPVINEFGVLGQVTRLYPMSSEVTLLTDVHAAVPVINLRSQQRSAAFGGTGGLMELRFMAANADVQVGDLLTTGGLDGVYPTGLPVAKVLSVERRGDAGFARIVLTPAAVQDGLRHVMVLEPLSSQLPLRMETATEPARAVNARPGKVASPAASAASQNREAAP